MGTLGLLKNPIITLLISKGANHESNTIRSYNYLIWLDIIVYLQYDFSINFHERIRALRLFFHCTF